MTTNLTGCTQPNGNKATLGKLRSLTTIRSRVAAVAVALSLAAIFGLARTSSAVPLQFTLSGVTFSDGSTASGFFLFDPTTEIFGPFSITTSAGTFSGTTYSPGAGSGTFFLGSPDAFIFDNFGVDDHYLVLSYSGSISAPGSYMLELGTPDGPFGFLGSGEYVNADFDYRVLTGGMFNVTVPDAGSALALLSIGLLAVEGFRRNNRRRQRA